VEIGGEFRIPEVMALAGARLVEVGTTNRTRLADYEKAITPDTKAILKVHPSNYRMIGFTSSVPSKDLARLARGRGLAFVNDLGSGLVAAPTEPPWTREEPRVTDAVAEGADVVTFSGDKLLGGPQAGLIVGRAAALAKLAHHALIRALRVDKMSLAALEATLDLYLRGSAEELPLWAMATAPAHEIQRRAEAMASGIRERVAESVAVDVVASASLTGGGSLPGTTIGSFAVTLNDADKTAAELERRLRRADPPVIALVEDGRVLLDLRTVQSADDEALADLVAAVINSRG
ncbi:MAG: L-seryl-tRNA(Sec) selenium transferase, partial [Actinomycetota bacterium]|nr:L-seryl-tRNA(Sec) selenium transferase [Actinomycetota bacterium]